MTNQPYNNSAITSDKPISNIKKRINSKENERHHRDKVLLNMQSYHSNSDTVLSIVHIMNGCMTVVSVVLVYVERGALA